MPAKISGYSTSGPLVPSKGSGAGGVAADKTQADAATPSAAAQAGDQVTLTTSARSLQKLSDAIAHTPVVNTDKVSSIKQALSNGTYKVDTARVADKLIRFESGLK